MVVTMMVVTMMVMTLDTWCKQARKGDDATRRVIFGQSLKTTNSCTRFEHGMNIFHNFIFLQFQNKDVRPPFTYAALIKQVRSQSTDTAMLQQGIQLLLLLSTLSYSVASLIGFNRFARNLTWCDVRLWRRLPASSWAWTRSTPGSPTTSPSTGTTRTAGRWGTVSTLLCNIFLLSGWWLI